MQKKNNVIKKGGYAMKKRLCGGYIQLWKDNRLTAPAVWEKVLLEMKELCMDTAIIQFMDTADGIKLDESKLMARIILKYAQQNHIKVFLGLYGHSDVGHPDSVKPEQLNTSKIKSIAVARYLTTQFREEKAFYGWHLPLESWTENYPSATITNLNGYYKSLTAELKRMLPDKKVLISPFINVGRNEPGTVQETYTKILHRTGIDFLALQDSVGAKYISVNDPELPTYFAAICAACTANQIEMWANAESFALSPFLDNEGKPKKTAAEPARFIKQLELSQGASRIVTFDFFHYMNSRYPLIGDVRPPGYKEDVELLNLEYRAWLQRKETVIADGPCHFG
ncbi:DUF4434 domain-containing protein [Desulfobulbus sp. F5]|nr:DUF4434 domain-containing protein [Desulfobulbus sp. F5]